MSSAISKIKKDFNIETQKVREEMKHISDNVKSSTVTSRSCTNATNAEQDLSLNIVIRNLPETNSENIKEKVESLVTDGLKLRISFENAIRKQSRNPNEHGVVIAKCKSAEDKSTIIKATPVLKSTGNYNQIYIEHDKSQNERNAFSNLKTIASIIGKDKVFVRGNRLLPRNDTRSDNQSYRLHQDNDEWQEVRHNRHRGARGSRAYGNTRDSMATEGNDNRQYNQRNSYGTRHTYNRNQYRE